MDTKLNKLIADTLHISLEIITDELSMSDVEFWDSLQHMNLIASLEQTYGIDFTFEEIIIMQTVAEIKRVLQSRGVEI